MTSKPRLPEFAPEKEGIFASTVMRSRLEVPPARKKNVPRTRLVDHLAGHANSAVVYISGIAGDGKTTLAQQWATNRQDAGHVVCWVSLAPNVNSPAMFLSYLAAAFEAGGIAVPARIKALLATSPVVPVQTVNTLLLNAVAETKAQIYLFLDDLQNVNDPSIQSMLEHLFHDRSENLHFVLTSREALPWSLPRLKANDNLIEITPKSLRFDTDETSKFFRKLGNANPATSDQIKQIFSKTEGWPVALHISSLALRNDGSEGSRAIKNWNRSDLKQFFSHEIVSKLPEELRNFMLATSVLGHFDVATSNAILEIDNSAELLERLSDLNFVPSPEENEVYYYHPLLADFLSDEFASQDTGRKQAVLLAASRYFHAQGHFIKAIEFAVATKDPDLAADIIEAHGMELVMASRVRRLREWLAFVPEESFAKRPNLSLLRIWMLFHMPHPRRALHELTRFNRQVRHEGASESRPADDPFEVEASVLIAGVLSATGFADRAREAALRTLPMMRQKPGFFKGTLCNILAFSELATGDMAAVRSASQLGYDNHQVAGSVFGMTWSDLLMAFSELEKGDLFKAEHHLRRTGDLAEKELGQGSYAASLLAVVQAELHYEWNQIEAAERLLDIHREVIETSAPLLLIGAVQILSAKIDFANGNRVRAVEALTRIVDAPVRSYPRESRCAALNELTRILLREQDFAAVQRAFVALRIESSEPVTDTFDEWNIALAFAALAKCRLQMDSGQLVSAINALRALAAGALQRECHRCAASARGLEVLCHWKNGDQKRSVALLRELCLDSTTSGLIRTIADIGPGLIAPLRALLSGLHTGEETHADTLRISAFCRAFLKLIAPHTEDTDRPDTKRGSRSQPQESDPEEDVTTLEPLTKRELEIARLMAHGLTNRVMSQQLNVTTETIKWHLKNIFQKLGVTNRTQAVIALSGQHSFLDDE
ncbi:MAG: LuxR C-terminal-related transcriptional regulator [Sulfitobacter sp.]